MSPIEMPTAQRWVRHDREGADPVEFAVTVHAIDAERHVLAVRGDLDRYTVPVLKELLAEAVETRRIRIVIDLTETTSLDSAARGVLIGTVKRLRSRHGALAIVNRDAGIDAIFEVMALDQILTIRATRDEAIAAVRLAGVA